MLDSNDLISGRLGYLEFNWLALVGLALVCSAMNSVWVALGP